MRSAGNIYNGKVEHVSADGTHARVRLADSPKCCGCAIAGSCASAGEGRAVEAAIPRGVHLSRHEAVRVKCTSELPFGDIWIWILIPCAILIGVTLIMQLATADYTVVTATALIATAAYFAIVGAWRAARRRRPHWVIITRKK